MIEALADQVELNSLVMLDNKRQYLDRINGQQANYIARQQAAQQTDSEGNMPGAAATTSATSDTGVGGIQNRSPVTNYHYYNAPSPAQPAAPAAQPTTPVTQPSPTPIPTPTTGKKPLPGWLIPAGIALLLATGAGGAWWLATKSPPSTLTPGTPAKLPTYSPDTTIKFS